MTLKGHSSPPTVMHIATSFYRPNLSVLTVSLESTLSEILPLIRKICFSMTNRFI